MEMDEMTKAELFDQFVDAVSRNPRAAAPYGLEPELVSIGRKIVVVENELAHQVAQNQSMQAYIWQRALAGAEAEWQVKQNLAPNEAMRDRKRRLWLFPLITVGLLLLAWLITLALREPESYRIAKPLPPTPIQKLVPTAVPTVIPPPTPTPVLGIVPETPDTVPTNFNRKAFSTEVPTIVTANNNRNLEDFKRQLTRDLTPQSAEKVFGKPDDITGSGLIIYIYKLADGSEVWLGFPGFDKITYAWQKLPNGSTINILPPGK
jgi:hypothetical protein